ncbi:MAG: DUF1963 domain-containing protein [Candidatus Riflebacteria bacterium]|nr:DUF1963 domain-containing protein [Candidatus Riflebacteria bacterium]
MSEALINALKKIKLECQRVIPEKPGFARLMAAETRFAGPAYSENEDIAPVCPVCGEKLSFVFQFYPQSDQKALSASPLLVFYYCFKCTPIGSENEEPGQWLIRSYQTAAPEKFVDGIGVDTSFTAFSCQLAKTQVLPDYETIEEKYPYIAEMCEEVDADDPLGAYEDAGLEVGCEMEPFTSIGGYPIWIQGEAERTCPICKKIMDFIGQIDSQQEVQLMWGDAGCVYLFQCHEHHDQFGMEMQCF